MNFQIIDLLVFKYILKVLRKKNKKKKKKKLVTFMEEYFSPLISANRTSHNSQHVIIRLLEEWRKELDDNFVLSALLTDLSKAFQCIPHDLLIAKRAMYILSYLSNRKQCVSINNTYSEFENIITGVPQDSILCPHLFNLSVNDLFFFIFIASVHNFVDDNTLSAFAKNVSKLINILQSESEVMTDWIKKNQMIVNPHNNR